jgi:predicted nucleotidyltransferase
MATALVEPGDGRAISRCRPSLHLAWQNPGVTLRPEIELDREALDAFCRRHGIRRLSVFGSALEGHFRPGSDIDLLVEFDPGRIPGLIRLAGMELELSPIFGGRDIELRTYEDLSAYFRDEVRANAEPVYVAA